MQQPPSPEAALEFAVPGSCPKLPGDFQRCTVNQVEALLEGRRIRKSPALTLGRDRDQRWWRESEVHIAGNAGAMMVASHLNIRSAVAISSSPIAAQR
jgi:hypothetical protein